MPACLPALTSSTVAPAADNAAIARAFADHRSELQVTAQGRVERLLSDDTSATSTHQRFILKLDDLAQTLLITNNVSVGKRVPVAAGDALVVHGEFIWNDQGGLVHFTHHDPDGSHESGWILRDGVRYE
ncbi:MAG: DUF3465 domain-containing protein [Chloroflexota bacterium]